jgi:hypothetical protein
MREGEIDEECFVHGREKKCRQNFGRKHFKKDRLPLGRPRLAREDNYLLTYARR